MKYKSVTIRPDLTGKKFNVHVYTVDGNREDYGENFNNLGFAYVYEHRSDSEAICMLRDHLVKAAAERIESLSKDIELLLRIK